MKSKQIIITLALIVPLLFIQNVATLSAQNGDPEIVEQIGNDQEEASILESSNMWDLVGQAGPIRYPIFAILIIGIFLISFKVMELYLDNRRATSLRNTPFTDFSLVQISKTLARQPEHMLSVIMAKLLNVFQTNRNADYLHDEISNYARFKQDTFNSFRNRIDFLSDTAGALGLLGTVWGMFIVFSSGTLERDTILAGMGLALMSTLLGLVVSIILNFASTLTEGYFTKRLARVTNKADELRFRFIELSENSTSVRASDDQNKETPVSKDTSGSNNRTQNKDNFLAEAFQKRRSRENESTVSKPKPENDPAKLVLKTDLNHSYRAGETISEIEVQLLGSLDKPVASQELEIVLNKPGEVNGKPGKCTVKTDKDGFTCFDWTLSKHTGKQIAGIRCSENGFHHVKKELPVIVKAGDPVSVQIINNHQAAVTGSEIPKPVMVVVKDEYGNPVSGVTLELEVSMGNGELPGGKQKAEKKTDDEGKLLFGFKLGDEPGFNAVDINVKGSDVNQKFQAVGQEVTV